MAAPLSGVKVLDFSTLLPGPMATLFLAEAGAEVIKIERPGSGEDMRHYPPFWGRESINFAMLNRGKKSLAMDLKNPDERERLRPLIESADVLVEQFRPGVMKRLGLDYEAVARINPTVIYCSISGFGQTGPKRDRAGHDLNYIGDAGLLFDPESLEEIVDCIRRLWTDDQLCIELSERGKKRAESWGPRQFNERLREIVDASLSVADRR